MACHGCKAVLHRECAEELPRCPIHGCRKRLSVSAPQRTRRRLSNAPANQPSLFEVLGIDSDDSRRSAAITIGIVVPMLLIGGCFSVFDKQKERRLRRARQRAQEFSRRKQEVRKRQLEAERRAREVRQTVYQTVRVRQSALRSRPGFAFTTATEGTPGLLLLQDVDVAVALRLEVSPGVIAPLGRQRFVFREEASFHLLPGDVPPVQFSALSLDLQQWRRGSAVGGNELRPADRRDDVELRAAAFARALARSSARRSDWLAAQVALLIVLYDPTPEQLFGASTPAMRRAALSGARTILRALDKDPEDFRAFGGARVPQDVLARFQPPSSENLPRQGAFVPLTAYSSDPEVRRLLGRYAGLPLWPGQLADLAKLLRRGGGLPMPAVELRRRLSAARTLGEAWVLLDSLLLAGDAHGIAGALEWAEDSLAEPLLAHLRERLGRASAGMSPSQLVRAARRRRIVRLDSPLNDQQRRFRANRLAHLRRELLPWRPASSSQLGSERALELLAFHFPRERGTHDALVKLAHSEGEPALAAARGLAHLIAGGGSLEVSTQDLLGGAKPASDGFRAELLRSLGEVAPAQLSRWIGPVLDAGPVSKQVAGSVTSALSKHAKSLGELTQDQLVRLVQADPVAVRLFRELPPERAVKVLLQPTLRPLGKPILSRLAYFRPLALSLLWWEELEDRERLASLEAIEAHGPRSHVFSQLVDHLVRRWSKGSDKAELRRLQLLATWSWRMGDAEVRPVARLIREALSSPEAERRLEAARLNVSRGLLRQLLPVLRRKLEFDPDVRVRRQLLESLARGQVSGCDQVAQRWIRGEDQELRRAAAHAMALNPWLGAKRFLPLLINDPDPEVRRASKLYETLSGDAR